VITAEQKIAFERMEVSARQLGVADERFQEICAEVEAKARTSLAWGTIDELRLRVLRESEKNLTERERNGEWLSGSRSRPRQKPGLSLYGMTIT
jgi:hypothetical protein